MSDGDSVREIVEDVSRRTHCQSSFTSSENSLPASVVIPKVVDESHPED